MSSNFVCNDALDEQIRLLLRARPILWNTGMISDRTGLNSILLPFHLSVGHIRKSDESNVLTENGFHFFRFCPCWFERRLTEIDGTVSDKIAGWTNRHLETQFFFVCSPNILNKSDKHLSLGNFYVLIMKFYCSYTLWFYYKRKLLSLLSMVRFYEEIAKWIQTIIFIGLIKAFLCLTFSLSNNEVTQLPENVFSGLRNLGSL